MLTGAIAAWASIGAGVAFLSPAALIASVVIGTASAAGVAVRVRQGAHRLRRLAIATVVAVVAGAMVLAILADGFGMAATGSLALAAGQLGAVLAVVVYAAVITLLGWATERAVALVRTHVRAAERAER